MTTIQARTALPIVVLAVVQVGACAAAAPVLSSAMEQDIRTQIQGRQEAYANCYTSALKHNEAVKGEMTLSFVVAPTGEFTQLEVSDRTNDERLKQCVTDATSGLRMSIPPLAPVQVSCPISFEPQAMEGKSLGELPTGESPTGESPTGAQPPPGAAPEAPLN